jgi:hypothetical protein
MLNLKLYGLICLILISAAARADVIYSDLGSGNTFSDLNAYEVSGANNPYLEETAASFTPALNYTLSQIDLAFTSFEDNNSAITVSLETNYTGGTVIESWNLNGPFPASGSTDNTLHTITPTGTYRLRQGLSIGWW